jgi:hypothetical protein
MKTLVLASILLAFTFFVSCDYVSETDVNKSDNSDDPATWDCVEAFTQFYEHCDLVDNPSDYAKEVCSWSGEDQFVSDCIKPNWPDCERMEACIDNY